MNCSLPRGNCYVTSEALYHLLGGKAAGWKPMTVRHEGVTHWYLERIIHGHLNDTIMVLDPTAVQFKTPVPYGRGRGRGFLTKKPSKRARALMDKLVWQTPKRKPRREPREFNPGSIYGGEL